MLGDMKSSMHVELGIRNLYVPAGRVTYVAPSLVFHSIDSHGYGLPQVLSRPCAPALTRQRRSTARPCSPHSIATPLLERRGLERVERRLELIDELGAVFAQVVHERL